MSKYLLVERDKVRANVRAVRAKAGNAVIYGVLKGNAYGFGLLDMADLLRDEGISRFAITEPRDLVVLRNSGFIDEEILVMRSTSIPDEVEKLIEYNAVATIGSYDTAIALNGMAEKAGAGMDAHIAIDTGMGRYGFLPSEPDKVIAVYKYLSSINISGMYTHFSKGYAGGKSVKSQYDAFLSVVGAVKRAGLEPGLLHAAASCALMKCPYTALDAVRIGSAFTGRLSAKGNFGLQRTGYAECQIVELRWLQKNQTVGYGGEYRCTRPTLIAVAPIGYADGVCAEKSRDMFRFSDAVHAGLSGLKAWMLGRRMTALVNGKTVRVLGHVGMNHIVLDVTDCPCSVGDVARFEVNPILAGAALPKKYV